MTPNAHFDPMEPPARTATTFPNAMSRDAALALARRLDWRILLPRPELGSVACLGAVDEDLRAALKHVSRTLRIVPAADLEGLIARRAESIDVLVASNCPARDLVRGMGLLAPGGAVYWEVSRFKGRAWPGAPRHAIGLRSARGCAARLARLGLEEVAIHWHRPSFTALREIIPLDHSPALARALADRPARLVTRLRLAAARAALGVGLLEYLVPCFSIVAVKPPAIGNGAARGEERSEP